MYPWRHFSLWTDPNNFHLLKLFYDKSEFEMKKYPEPRSQLFKTTFKCSWCSNLRPLVESHFSTYLEMAVIACNPMKYLLMDDLIMCGTCARDREREPTLPEPSNRFYRPRRSINGEYDIERRLPVLRYGMPCGSEAQLIINNSDTGKLKQGYYTLVSNYQSEIYTDIRTRIKFFDVLHPRYRIDSSLFDILYINLAINLQWANTPKN